MSSLGSESMCVCVCVVKTPCEDICVGYLECVACSCASPTVVPCTFSVCKRKRGFVYVFSADICVNHSLVQVWLGLFAFYRSMQCIHLLRCVECLCVPNCIIGLCIERRAREKLVGIPRSKTLTHISTVSRLIRITGSVLYRVVKTFQSQCTE